MNHMTGLNKRLNPGEGRQIVEYINRRIEEKNDMERRGVPFFRANEEAFESQDVKRMTILDKVFKTRVTPFKHKRVKEFKITSNQKPFWWELTGANNAAKVMTKRPEMTETVTPTFTPVLGPLQSPSLLPSPSASRTPETETEDESCIDEEPFSWRARNFFDL